MILFKHVKYFGEVYQVYIDDRKRTVEARYSFGKTSVSGVAKCHPDDNFNPDLGMKIALNRCAVKVVRKMAEQARYGKLAIIRLIEEFEEKLNYLYSENEYIYKNILK